MARRKRTDEVLKQEAEEAIQSFGEKEEEKEDEKE